MVSPQKISSYLRKPYELDAAAEQDIRGLIKEYPYFNVAWLLLARNLHNQNSPLFDEGLKQAAMQAGERSLLYKLVNIDEADAPESVHTAPVVAEKLPEVEPAPVVVEVPEPEKEVVMGTASEAEIAEETPVTEVETETVTADIEATDFVLNVDEPPIIIDEQPETVVAQETAVEDEEANKMASAYDEIFGSTTPATEVATDFETFEIEHNHEEDFAASEVHGLDAEGSEETFELKIADRLDTADGDGVVVPAPEGETTEEKFELNTADAIARGVEQTYEDDFVLDIGDTLDAEGDAEILPHEEPVHLAVEVAQHEQETPVTVLPANEEPTIEAPVAEEEPVESTEISQPIAFKLTAKETETPAKQPEPEPMQEEESVLISSGTFYEWLAQLKKLQPSSEKKNDITEAAAKTETLQNSGPAEVAHIETKTDTTEQVAQAPKKSTVDDIISRFISINPTISRPKAEFYNPAAKSKESDAMTDDLATETLAKIYRGQKLYERAIGIYERLIEIFPAKTEEYRRLINEIKTEIGG